MRIIGVIDLMGARAVTARGGDRSTYQPLQSTLLRADQIGDAVALAHAYGARRDVTEIYVADLDAIAGRPPNDLEALRHVGLPLLVDAGVRVPDALADADRRDPARRTVIGLETLHALDDLAACVRVLGPRRSAFSLDMRAGTPILSPTATLTLHAMKDPVQIATAAAACGCTTMIVLDLARVGTRSGLDWQLVGMLRDRLPTVELLVGGGIRDMHDVDRLASLGCDAVLVGSAFHDGRLSVSMGDAWRP